MGACANLRKPESCGCARLRLCVLLANVCVSVCLRRCLSCCFGGCARGCYWCCVHQHHPSRASAATGTRGGITAACMHVVNARGLDALVAGLRAVPTPLLVYCAAALRNIANDGRKLCARPAAPTGMREWD